MCRIGDIVRENRVVVEAGFIHMEEGVSVAEVGVEASR